MTKHFSSSSEVVMSLMVGAAPERQADIERLWQKYKPRVDIHDNACGITLNATGERIAFDLKTIDVFWLIGFSGWRAIRRPLSDPFRQPVTAKVADCRQQSCKAGNRQPAPACPQLRPSILRVAETSAPTHPADQMAILPPVTLSTGDKCDNDISARRSGGEAFHPVARRAPSTPISIRSVRSRWIPTGPGPGLTQSR